MHYLKRNHASAYPSEMLFLDTETKERTKGTEKHLRMRLAWTCFVQVRNDRGKHTEVWRDFRSTEALWSYVVDRCRPKHPLWVFAHNAFFDLQASDFFHYLTLWKWKREFYYDNGFTYILCLRNGDKCMKIVSTTNYFAGSLAELGKAVGIEKTQVDFRSATESELSSYCRNDVSIMVSFILQYLTFLREHDLGTFRYTRASQSFAAYRHRFMHEKIAIHSDEDVQSLEKSAYYGGRVECFRLGKQTGGPFASFDVNSMYPFVMKEHLYPTRLVDIGADYPLDKLRVVLERYGAVAQVVVETDTPLYPVRLDDVLIFPVGRFRTFLTTPSLKVALARGHLVAVESVAFYEMADLFSDYVDYFYRLKVRYTEEGNTLYRSFVKVFMNSLYGKFGQQVPLVESCEPEAGLGYTRLEEMILETGESWTVTVMLNVATTEHSPRPGPTSFIAIAAHVTDYARCYLSELIETVGWDKVLYCDTDSLKLRLVDADKLKPYLNDTKLGSLNHEGTFSSFIIYGPKDYVQDEKIKVKGVPRNAVSEGNGVYTYDTFTGQATHLRRGVTRFYILKGTKKVLRREYKKGRVRPGGKVDPPRLDTA